MHVSGTEKSDEKAGRFGVPPSDGPARKPLESGTPSLTSHTEAKPGTGMDRRFLWIYIVFVGSLLVRVSVLDFESEIGRAHV